MLCDSVERRVRRRAPLKGSEQPVEVQPSSWGGVVSDSKPTHAIQQVVSVSLALPALRLEPTEALWSPPSSRLASAGRFASSHHSARRGGGAAGGDGGGKGEGFVDGEDTPNANALSEHSSTFSRAPLFLSHSTVHEP